LLASVSATALDAFWSQSSKQSSVIDHMTSLSSCSRSPHQR
jgi:hypothetical protein